MVELAGAFASAGKHDESALRVRPCQPGGMKLRFLGQTFAGARHHVFGAA